MTDTSTTPKAAPTFARAIQSAAVVALGMFLIFGGAALGWHAGAALARVIGL